jgi:quercetin dioxygenase-like cupin family protein
MPEGLARLVRLGEGPVRLAPGPFRALYVWRGALSGTVAIGAGQGVALGAGACEIAPGPGCAAFLWEVSGPATVPTDPGEMLRHAMPLLPGETPATGRAAVLRFERVDLNPGAATPRHTHRGSGLRVLVEGRIEAEVGDARLSLHPGDAWLEKGPDEPVIGRTLPGTPAAFVRLLVLPADMAGQDSFVLLEDGPADRPRPARYERFFETRISL